MKFRYNKTLTYSVYHWLKTGDFEPLNYSLKCTLRGLKIIFTLGLYIPKEIRREKNENNI